MFYLQRAYGGTRGIIAYSAWMHIYGNKLGLRAGAHMSVMTCSCHSLRNMIEMMTKTRETFSLEFKCSIVVLFNKNKNPSMTRFLDTLDYRALGRQKGYLKESTVRGWLKDNNVQMSISSPQFFDRLDEARKSKRKQGRYHHFETGLARKLQQDIDYQKGYTIK
jgi:hypothetical protein